MKTFRLLFLGAGFSKLAGLPLGTELFYEIRRVIKSRSGKENWLEWELSRYIEYIRDTKGKTLKPEEVNIEEFLGFLDIEHYLGLKGKDTFSAEGNEAQLMVRKTIGQILFERTPTGTNIPSVYRRFAQQLTANDWVFTFNYDTLLEQALELEGIPYRLFPYRYSKVGKLSSTIDNSHPDELVLLKLHGSIDWFDRSRYDESVEISKSTQLYYDVKHPIFGSNKFIDATPLVDGPLLPEDPLTKLYRVQNLKLVYEQPFWECVPFILAPSSTKIFYFSPLREFWWGIQRSGGLNLSLGIIGYSLPSYDSYARQAIYSVVKNFTGFEPNLSFDGRAKSKVRILDFRPTQSGRKNLRRQYQFLDWKQTEVRWDGFNDKNVDWFLR